MARLDVALLALLLLIPSGPSFAAPAKEEPGKTPEAGKAPAGKAPAGKEEKGQGPGEWSICMVDVKNVEVLVEQGFRWMTDMPTVDRLSDMTASYLACSARVQGKDPCEALKGMQKAFKYDKRIGDYQARCRELGRYAAFYNELKTAPKRSRKFPRCAEFLGGIAYPMKIFAADAVAPRSSDPDPTNDGKFWNVCADISRGLREGKSDFCSNPRLKYWLQPGLDPMLWEKVCALSAKMWLQGDDEFCGMIPQDVYCKGQAAWTRAMVKGDGSCPPTSPDEGLCAAAAAKEPKKACEGLWAKLQSDFCTERARFKPEELPAKPKATESKPR